MMRAMVLVESMFGNTRAVADAIADGMPPEVSVDVVDVADAPVALPGDVDLLVVGAPTHALGMSRPGSRAGAAEQAPEALRGDTATGVREWLAAEDRLDGITVAAFDTRMRGPAVLGTAAPKIDRALRKRGARRLDDPHGFVVGGTTGPLNDGELRRASDWGEHLGHLLVDRGRRGA